MSHSALNLQTSRAQYLEHRLRCLSLKWILFLVLVLWLRQCNYNFLKVFVCVSFTVRQGLASLTHLVAAESLAFWQVFVFRRCCVVFCFYWHPNLLNCCFKNYEEPLSDILKMKHQRFQREKSSTIEIPAWQCCSSVSYFFVSEYPQLGPLVYQYLLSKSLLYKQLEFTERDDQNFS